ncbi:YihY/virulence factor BrkB family protein [Qipengyuania gelatinilytica]|uniref:YihY family inner membrane protein n=1 Tax=Qipengyuania gelatinilytica TaxID=2867231 RepID=A0ABX8ZYV1_9SPHN|nr:YhjD/YihY/BrkB family envelope integrity protein [Qipengyuania gelatinilytica]QZD94178.1 YihY family inner membrane protein [Qipengyuania gelatinilytica]
MFADLKAAWSAGSNNNISLIAAGIAHYALLALVPALAALVLGYGLFANPDTVAADIQFLSKNLPQAAASLIGDELRNLTGGPGKAKGLGLFGSLAIALFGARSAAMALMTGLNITFHAGEPRSLVRGNLVALAITIGGIVGLAIMGGASAALAVLSGPAGSILGFIVLAAGAVGGAAALYRFAPNRRSPEWSAVLPGAVLFAFGWIVATAAFAFYAANFGSYNATYGSLGAVVVLITWFYATAFLLLLGAELAAVKGRGNDVSPSKAS